MNRIIETGPAPEVHIESTGGELALRGWGDETMRVQADDECNIRVERNGESFPDEAEGQGPRTREAADEAEETRSGSDVATEDVATDNVPRIYIRAPGDCSISVPYNARVYIGNVGGDCSIKDLGEAISIDHVGGECRIHESGAVELNRTGGDCSIQSADGKVALNRIGGDLRLHETGDLAVTEVGGDANLQRVRGNVAINQVSGNLRGREISGHLTVEVGGDLSLKDIEQNIQARANGNANLTLDLAPAQRINVNAGGDLRCRIPQDADAQVHARSGGDLRVRDLPVDITDSHIASFVLGDSETEAATLNLEARGNILLEGVHEWGEGGEFSAEWTFGARTDDLADLITRQVESKLQNLSRHLEERLSTSDDLAARIQEKVQKAMRQAERKIAQAVEKAEARAQRAEEEAARREARRQARDARHQARDARRGRSGGGTHTYTYATPPVPPKPPKPPKSPAVSEEERLRILRMVDNGVISVEQAEKLLAALNQ